MRYLLIGIVMMATACSPTTEEVAKELGEYKSGNWAIATEQKIDYGLIFDAEVYQDGNVITVVHNGEWGCYWLIPTGGVRPLTEQEAMSALKNERGH